MTPLPQALLVLVLCAALTQSGCASLAATAVGTFANNLSMAVLNQEDPETVREGAPAYLLLLDAVVEATPNNPEMLGAAASLYAVYATVFAGDPERARTLSARASRYGDRALCAQNDDACEPEDATYDAYVAMLGQLRPDDAMALYAWAVSRLAYTRAHRDDWVALADLPKIEAALDRVRALDPAYQATDVNRYLGILATLRPAALGGAPEEGRRYFERALTLSEGRDLSVKVDYARGYARLVYDRELHDRLLTEVVEAEPEERGLTLFNILAQREARELLTSADEYF